ncbi:hypothetical protein ACH41E_04815 [Streptomyces sp. NPDC020412]|uniref:hypothetical protein n=1 Tax=Streptomyces sp. NPDC020412 TaxID=3365073 RepID=UPI0037B96684
MTQQAQWTRVTTAGELMDAVRSEVPAIDVSGVLRGMPMLTMPPGVRLRGGTLVFGDLDRLDVRAPLTTHGVGARGFNVYDGTLQHAEFDSITTTGDGAIGVQVSRDLPQLDIRGDLTTSGGTGSSLVRGVQTGLAATALSVKPGGRIGRVTVGGRIASEGDRLTTVEVDGELDSLTARGGISAAGRGADAVHVGDFALDLSGVTITAVHGRAVVQSTN